MTPTAREIALFLGASLDGEDMALRGCASIAHPRPGHLGFMVSPTQQPPAEGGSMLLLVPAGHSAGSAGGHSIIRVEDPKLAFNLVVEQFFASRPSGTVSDHAVIHPDARLGRNCSIGEFAVLEEGVQVGDDCVIGHHTVIGRNCRIGARCRIGAGVVLGSDGLSCRRDVDGHLVPLRHLGSVVLRENVEIGANSTIQRGSLTDTIIGPGVKTSPQVNIGHNCEIGGGTMLAAGCCICGSACVGSDCFIGAGAMVRESVRIGNGCMIGMQATVVRDAPDGQTIMGLESFTLRTLARIRRSLGL
jgi:UDP-3-O-[3-hydroxymyristoyl] glucosamine N-acyltransferase